MTQCKAMVRFRTAPLIKGAPQPIFVSPCRHPALPGHDYCEFHIHMEAKHKPLAKYLKDKDGQ
ncbi:MAG: hypothetical protein AAGF48_13055 [Pseudomonadota bacterium]